MIDNRVMMTCDLDNATPIQVIHAVEIFKGMGIPVTYFSTGDYVVMNEVAEMYPRRVCPHPYMSGVGQKSQEFDDRLNKARFNYPEAMGYRCHGHTDSAWIQMAMVKRGFEWESNMCCHLEEDLAETMLFSGLRRFPVWLEDDVWMEKKTPFKEIAEKLEKTGLKVMNFHPVHICENEKVQALLYWITGRIDTWTALE